MSAQASGSSMTRRHWVAIALGSIAVGAGTSFAWRKMFGGPAQPVVSPSSAQAFWSMSFERPDGGILQAAEFRGKPLLLNFWATWCPPCLKEMPLLDSFHRVHGWQVLGLAVDQAEPVRLYLQRVPVEFPIALAGVDGVTLARELGNAGGQLPYTVIFDSQGRLADRHLGAVDETMLSNWKRKIS